MNQAVKIELTQTNPAEDSLQSATPLRRSMLKQSLGSSAVFGLQRQVVHSRDAATADAVARVVARYSQLPSYSSLQPDWRTKKIKPAPQRAATSNAPVDNATKSQSLPVNPLAWLSEVEELTAQGSCEIHSMNDAVSSNSAQEAGVLMNAPSMEASETLREWSRNSPDQIQNQIVNEIPEQQQQDAAAHQVAHTNLSVRAAGIQLNIFEVDPGTLSLDAAAVESEPLTIEPHAFTLASHAENTIALLPAHTPEPQIFVEELAAPFPEIPPSAPIFLDTTLDEGPVYEPIATPYESQSEILRESSVLDSLDSTPRIEAAPFNRRILAGVLDLALTLCGFSALILAAAAYSPTLLGAQASITLLFFSFIAVAALYQVLSTLLLRETPGERFAQLDMSTLGTAKPTRRQLALRLLLMPVSILPLGLGLLAALVDERGLCWHDRLSGTCLRYRY